MCTLCVCTSGPVCMCGASKAGLLEKPFSVFLLFVGIFDLFIFTVSLFLCVRPLSPSEHVFRLLPQVLLIVNGCL